MHVNRHGPCPTNTVFLTFPNIQSNRSACQKREVEDELTLLTLACLTAGGQMAISINDYLSVCNSFPRSKEKSQRFGSEVEQARVKLWGCRVAQTIWHNVKAGSGRDFYLLCYQKCQRFHALQSKMSFRRDNIKKKTLLFFFFSEKKKRKHRWWCVWCEWSMIFFRTGV